MNLSELVVELESQVSRLLKRRDDAALIATVAFMLCVLSLFSEKELRIYVFWGAGGVFLVSAAIFALTLWQLKRITGTKA